MATHTPGPWSLNQYEEPVDAAGENIRAKGLSLTNTDEAKANSRLIAAAPDLLKAVHALLRVATWDDEGVSRADCLAAVEVANAAVAKVEGRSS